MDAESANEAGREALEREDYQEAIARFREATVAAPGWSTPYYNLGLACKFAGDWSESRAANLRAFELDPEDEAIRWNLAIASVALSDWNSAGRAFKAIGLKIPEGEPPWDFRLGLIPIRVNPDTSPEVVWCHRLDPVRARIANVPLPDCGRRYGDLVLNDGEPRGYREYKGRDVPVFNELMLLERSVYSTFQVDLKMSREGGLDDLMARFEEHMVPVENWTKTLRLLCQACSEGRPHEHHDQQRALSGGQDQVRLGIAATDPEQVWCLLENWSGGTVLQLERVL